MKMDDYQYNAMLFRKDYPAIVDVLGLAGEAGEVTELYKKFIRGDGLLEKDKVLLELGDVLWYISAVAKHAGFTLEEVASANLTKLEDRHGKPDVRSQ